jgi:hypothetical protein
MNLFKGIDISNGKSWREFATGTNYFGFGYFGFYRSQRIIFSFLDNHLEIEWSQIPPNRTIIRDSQLKVRIFTVLKKRILLTFSKVLQNPYFDFSAEYHWEYEYRSFTIHFAQYEVSFSWKVVLSKNWLQKERQEYIEHLKNRYEGTQEYRDLLKEHDEFMAKPYAEHLVSHLSEDVINFLKEN